MKLRSIFAAFLAITIAIHLAVQTPAQAAALPSPYEVALSPNMALVKIKTTVKLTPVGPGMMEARLPIPGTLGVRTNTVTLNLPEYRVLSMGINNDAEVLPVETIIETSIGADSAALMNRYDSTYGVIDPNTRRGRLIMQMRALKNKKFSVEGEYTALRAAIARWTLPVHEEDKTTASVVTLPEPAIIQNFNAACLAELPALLRKTGELLEQSSILDVFIQQTHDSIRAEGGTQRAMAELVVTLEIPGRLPDSPVTVDYSYYDPSAGWTPSYSFDADAEKNTVHYTRSAYIWKKNPSDWSNTRLTINTLNPDGRLTPNPLESWQVAVGRESIKSNKSPQPRALMAASAPVASEEVYDKKEAEYYQPAPVLVQYATFSEWNLGVQTVTTGKPLLLPLDAGSWQAAFYYTVRPSQERSGFLTAKITLPAALDFARGNAIFMNNGRYTGASSFACDTNEIFLSFGPDRLITGEMENLAAQTGESGFFSKDTTMDWQWRFTLKNGRDRAVKIRVEDPRPQLMDKGITLKVDSSPKPETDKQTWYWERDLAPGESFSIRHAVSASAPADTTLYPGRGTH